MKKIFKTIIILLGLFPGIHSYAADNRWAHIGPLKSSNLTILLDYQIQTVRGKDPWYPNSPQGPMTFTSTASPIWINVLRGGLNPNDRVKAMVISYVTTVYRGQRPYTGVDQILEVNLNYAEPGRFTTTIKPHITSAQFNDGYALTTKYYRQELVIWINGAIYKDPNSGNNFSFDLSRGSYK